MQRSLSLPLPDPVAHEHSAQLAERLRAEIAAAGGVIPFSRFMERCLYEPGLGYYSAGSAKFGKEGDFVTAPELGSLFARCMAHAWAPLLRELGPEAQVLELGGGSGAFARDALLRLAELQALPATYAILEPSAELAQRQRQCLSGLPADLSARVRWLMRPPESSWHGILFANEVIDALPATRFLIRAGEVYEEGVELDAKNEFRRIDLPADALVRGAVRQIEHALGARLPEGYRSEVLPQLPYWLQAVAGGLQRGLLLFVDYGYPRREFYLPQRHDGTLVCHYRHRAHGDPFFLPGLQDITAFIDFTALAESGVAAGFSLAGYCSQAGFLIANGLEQELAQAQSLPEPERLRRSMEAKRLTLPGEMGERFQVMGLTRGLDASALFEWGDRSYSL